MATQNHIHLSTELGGEPELAPTLKFRATERIEFVHGDVDVVRGATGKLFFGTIRDDNGDPVLNNEFDYHLLVTESELDSLKDMVHKPVYFVDHVHPDDGEDHTAYVKDMILSTLKHIRRIDPMLNLRIVGISLLDNTI